MVFIKHLPKDKLLYELWKSAKTAQYMYYCKDIAPILTIDRVKRDINFMLQEHRKIDLTTYYGRLIFMDLTDDYVDTFSYDLYNGIGSAEKIITELKQKELQMCILKYYTFY